MSVVAVPAPARRLEAVMGTTVELDVRDEGVDAEAIDRAFAWLHDVDARFSTYRADSEISRLGGGELAETAASADVQEVLARCEELRRRTDGYFDIRAHRRDGRPDPSGLVKGWALERAAEILGAGGACNFLLNGGGDVIARGHPEAGRPWRVGIRNPLAVETFAAVVGVRDLAVATSGAYERGEHVLDPHTGRPPGGILSLTVAGPSMTLADAFATAAFAMGREGIGWLARQPGYSGCAITADERLIWTDDFGSLLLRP